MKKTGEKLKAARLAQSLDIQVIGDKLKISSQILRAIENGDLTELPPKTFLRGFVQSYAKYLKLNSDEILTTFFEEMGSTRPQSNSEEENDNTVVTAVDPLPAANGETVNKMSLVLAGVFLVVLSLGFLGLYNLAKRYQAETVIKDPEQKVVAIEEPTPKENIEEPQLNEPEVTPLVPQQQTPSPAAAQVEKAVPTPAPATESQAISAAPQPTTTETPPPVAKPVVNSSRSQEVIVEAFDNIQIEFSIDGGEFKKESLSADQVRTLKGQRSIKFKVNNGGAVNIISNGRDLGVPTSLGQSFEKSFE